MDVKTKLGPSKIKQKIYQATANQKKIALVTIIPKNRKVRAIFYRGQKKGMFSILKRTGEQNHFKCICSSDLQSKN